MRLTEAEDPGMLNIWVSLTPGTIKQQPLAFLMTNPSTKQDVMSSLNVSSVLSTLDVTFPGFNDTISVLRSRVAEDPASRFGWRPNTQFGEAVMFYTYKTPHSAVWLPNGPKDAPRKSAELRVLVTDRPALHE